VPEGGGEMARKLPRGDVVLVVCLAGADRGWSVGTTARLSGGGARVTGAVVWAARVRESEIGLLSELQLVVVVLLEHWITGVGRRRRLTTMGRSCGGAPARVVERRKKEEAVLRGEMGKRSQEGLLGKL
jgi:hypothetical protein